jgi:ribosome-binding protein aMBF1 (putative translation factor)
MLVPTKKHPTNHTTIKVKDGKAVLTFVYKGHLYNIPKSVAEKYEDKSKVMHDNVLPETVFSKIENKYTKVGVLLRGARHREGLTQAEMAKKINVSQADLSKMENGKRSIGKVIAKRIEKILGVNYRYFL